MRQINVANPSILLWVIPREYLKPYFIKYNKMDCFVNGAVFFVGFISEVNIVLML